VISDAGGTTLESNTLAYDNPALDRCLQSPSTTPDQKQVFHSEVTRLSDPSQGADEELYTDTEEDESSFASFALLSHLAVHLRSCVPRGTHVKGSIPYPRAFTGKDIAVSVME
jgi:hypothetical protein